MCSFKNLSRWTILKIFLLGTQQVQLSGLIIKTAIFSRRLIVSLHSVLSKDVKTLTMLSDHSNYNHTWYLAWYFWRAILSGQGFQNIPSSAEAHLNPLPAPLPLSPISFQSVHLLGCPLIGSGCHKHGGVTNPHSFRVVLASGPSGPYILLTLAEAPLSRHPPCKMALNFLPPPTHRSLEGPLYQQKWCSFLRIQSLELLWFHKISEQSHWRSTLHHHTPKWRRTKPCTLSLSLTSGKQADGGLVQWAKDVANNAILVLVVAYMELTQKNQIYVGLILGTLRFMEEHFWCGKKRQSVYIFQRHMYIRERETNLSQR